MRRFKVVFGLLAALFMVTAASPAQARNKAKLGVAGTSIVPLGDWGDSAGIGLGALLTVDFGLTDKLQLTGRAGYVHHLAKEVGAADVSFSQIPVFAGLKYFVAKGVYAGGEIGMNYLTVKTEVELLGQTKDKSDSEMKLAGSLGLGYMIKDVDLRGALMFADLGEAGDSMGLMLSAGYRFTAL